MRDIHLCTTTSSRSPKPRARPSWMAYSASQWSKQALKLEETKEILRHANIQTTSDIDKGLPLEAKRAAQPRLVEFIRAEAKKSSDQTVSD